MNAFKLSAKTRERPRRVPLAASHATSQSRILSGENEQGTPSSRYFTAAS